MNQRKIKRIKNSKKDRIENIGRDKPKDKDKDRDMSRYSSSTSKIWVNDILTIWNKKKSKHKKYNTKSSNY